MDRMEGIKDVTGLVESLEEKPFTKQTTGESGNRWVIRIGGKRISGFNKVPDKVYAAFKSQEETTVTYKPVESGGRTYNNFVGVKSDETPGKPTVDESEFKSGEDIPPADNPLLLLQDATARIGNHAREAFKDVYGAYPDITKDGQCAIVDTYMIFMEKCSLMEKFKRARPGTSLDEVMKNGK